MELIRLIEVAFAGWYLAYAITSTHGPGGAFNWIRENIWHGRTRYSDSPNHVGYAFNGLLDCIICLMPWICLVLWLVPDGIIIWAFAAAGLGLLLHSYTGWRYNG